MNKHYTFQEYFEKFTSIQDSYDYYFELQKEIDRLENIIKEVREYIEKYINRDFFDLEHSGEVTIRLEIKGLLEILDKENKE